MGFEQNGAVAFRHIGARARLFGTGDDDALQNINTTDLNDGCLVYVVEFAGYYMLDKVSTAAASGDAIVLPGSGPGRWFFFGSPAGAAELWAAYAMVTTPEALTGLTQSTWVDPPAPGGAIYALNSPGPDFWTLDTATGLLTYGGSDSKPFEVTVNASVASGTGSAASIEVVADTGALVGTTTDDFYAGRGETVATAGNEIQLTSSKIIRPTNGDAIRPIFRNLTVVVTSVD